MENFKNIISQDNFKLLGEKYNSINESMDFSNRTGFSQSLIGRAINKTFSFAMKNVYKRKLRKLSDEIKDEYLKAIVATFYEMGIEAEKLEVVKSITLDAIQTTIQKNGNTENNIKKLKTKIDVDEKISTFLALPAHEEKINKEQLIQGQEKLVKVKRFKKEKKQFKKTYSNQITMIKSIINYINKDNLSDNDLAMISFINNKLSTEIEIIKKNKLDTTPLEELKNKLTELPRTTKTISEEDYNKRINLDKSYLGIINDIIDKNPQLSKFKKNWNKRLYPDTNDISQIKKEYKKIKNEIEKQGIQVNENILLVEAETGLAKTPQKTNTNLTQTSKEQSDSQSDSQGSQIAQTPTTQIIQTPGSQNVQGQTEEVTEKEKKITDLVNDTVGDTITKTSSDSPKVKKALNKFGNLKYKDFDLSILDNPNKILTDAQIKEFYSKVRPNVNKERLKVLALEAEILYDPEFGVAKNAVYSRVNFTTVDTDKKKIEQYWKKLISQDKEIYLPYFSQTGSFPEDLDPIALINSDKAMRKSFAEYNIEAKKNIANFGSNEINENPSQNKAIGIVLNGDTDDKLYIFDTNNNPPKRFGMILRTVPKNKEDLLTFYHFKGLFDFDGLIKKLPKEKEELDKLTDDKIKILVDKYYLNNSQTIRDLYEGDEEKINLNIFQTFRKYVQGYDKSKGGKMITLYVSGKDKINYGKKQLMQVAAYNNNLYVMKTDGNQIIETIPIEQAKNMEFKNFNYVVDLKELYGINNKKIWNNILNRGGDANKEHELEVDIEEIIKKYKNDLLPIRNTKK